MNRRFNHNIDRWRRYVSPVSVCLSLSVSLFCINGSEAIFFAGVVFVGVLGWRVSVLARGGGVITTDPFQFPCSG